MLNLRILATALAGIALVAAPVYAAPSNDYQGPNAGAWDTASNWSAGAIPNGANGTYYDVTNSSGNSVVFGANAAFGSVETVDSLNFTGTGGLTLSGGIIAGSQPSDASLFSVSGPLLISGGTLRNVTLMNSDAAVFGLSTTSSDNTLDSVTLSGGLTLDTEVSITGSFAYGAGATFDLSSNGILGFSIDQTLANAILKEGAYGSLISVNSSHTLTLDSTLAVSGADAAFNGGTIASGTLLSSSQGGQWNITPTKFTNNATVETHSANSALSINVGQFTNNGTLQAVGGSVYAGATTFVNNGTIQALSDGSVSLSPYAYKADTIGVATASGTGSVIYLAGGTLTLGQGEQLSATNGGAIDLLTTLNSAGKTFDPLAYAAPGLFVVDGGTISGGTIANSDSLAFKGNSNVLNNVSLSGGLVIGSTSSNANVDITGSFAYGTGSTFQINFGSLSFQNSETLDNVSFVLGSGGYGGTVNDNSGTTLTLGANVSMSGPDGTLGADHLINNGAISSGSIFRVVSETSDGTSSIINNGSMTSDNNHSLYVGTSTLTNTGTISAKNGAEIDINNVVSPWPHPTLDNQGVVFVGTGSLMRVQGFQQSTQGSSTEVDGTLNTSLTLNAGSLTGNGTISGSVTNSGGTLLPASSGGPLAVIANTAAGSGDYTQTAGGTFLEELGGSDAGQFSVLSIGKLAALDGALDVSLVNGFAPTVGQTFTFLDYNSLSGAFANVTSMDTGYGYSLAYGPSSAVLTVTSVAAAPEPSEFAALGLGMVWLAGCMMIARKRKQRARA